MTSKDVLKSVFYEGNDTTVSKCIIFFLLLGGEPSY